MKAKRFPAYQVALMFVGATILSGTIAQAAKKPAAKRPAASQGVVYAQCLVKGTQRSRWIADTMPFKVWMSHGQSMDTIANSEGVPVTNTSNTAGWGDAAIQLLQNPEQIGTLPMAQGYTDEQYQAAMEGINSWKPLENEKLFAFEFTDKPDEADVCVFWTHHFVDKHGLGLFENDIRGMTSRHLLPVKQVMQALQSNNLEMVRRSRKPVVILLRTTQSDGQPMTQPRMRAASAHEFGHALGIDGHSPYPTDLMSVFYGRGVQSPNDVATMRYLYRNPADLMP